MKKKKVIETLLISLFLISHSQMGFSQEYWLFDRWEKLGYDHDKGYSISYDTLTKDTIFESLKNLYREIISVDGVVLSYGGLLGGMGTDCGCEAKPHGFWINRNRDNTIKDMGEYYCNQKIGTWYYFENKTVSKIESYSKAYPNYERKGNRLTYLNGPYFQFHPNGKLKIDGFYRIIEEYSSIDTVILFNYDLYEEEIKTIYGDFWHPKSVKYGNWKYYNELGEFIAEENKLINLNDKKIRYPEMKLLEHEK